VYLHELFRSFLPLRNPLGFGVADFVVLSVAVLLTICLVLRAALWPYLARPARRPAPAMLLLAGLTVVLRLFLLGSSPVPLPAGADDFSYVLLADTLRHWRFANPIHPLYPFFESVFVLQQPTYSSIYPPGQGFLLALGRIICGSYWAGVLLSAGALSAFCYWMLRAWVNARWALAGGLLAVIQFGPLNPWTNSYWGGSLSACAGCLVFGALPRLEAAQRETDARSIRRYGLILGTGLSLELLTRPFEFLLLAACVLVYWLCFARSRAQLFWLLAGVPVLLAIALMLAQNKSVTGSWITLPYVLSRYQYGVPTTFTWQPNPEPHRTLTPEQELDYRAQAAIHGSGKDTLPRFFERLAFRIRYLRFFLLAPLYLALPFVLASLKNARWAWSGATIAIFFLGTNFYPYFYPHYIAVISSLCVLLAVKGLESLARRNSQAAGLLLCLCGSHFGFWYLIHFSGNDSLMPATSYESWDFINYGDPEGRRRVNDTLAQSAGAQLVFVRYSPLHRFQEWIANDAEIDRAKVVWARDLGPVQNRALIQYFPARQKWLLEPDVRPPKLTAYSADAQVESLH
jgi:hypothetical protein